MPPVLMEALDTIVVKSIRQIIETRIKMDMQDMMSFAQELREIVWSIEYLMEPGDLAGNYNSQCAIDRIKSSEYWIDENDC